MLNKITASLICMNLADIKTDLDTLIENGVTSFHADFMDNTFVPRLGISPELIQWMRKRYGREIEIDSHLMVQNPYDCVDVIAPFSDWVFFHYEAVPDPVRILQKIEKVSSANRGIAYNIGTKVFYDLFKTGLVDGIMFMGISPGVLTTKSWPEIIRDKIVAARFNEGAMPGDTTHCQIFVDGGVKFDSISSLLIPEDSLLFRGMGADKLVCGSSTLFKIDEETKGLTRPEMIKYNIHRIKEALK